MTILKYVFLRDLGLVIVGEQDEAVGSEFTDLPNVRLWGDGVQIDRILAVEMGPSHLVLQINVRMINGDAPGESKGVVRLYHSGPYYAEEGIEWVE